MEITSTILTKTARHATDHGVYNIDYTITNGKLDRIQLNIFRPPAENEAEVYLGMVYYDGQNITCNIPWTENAALYFDTAADFIENIIESAGDEPTGAETKNDKSR